MWTDPEESPSTQESDSSSSSSSSGSPRSEASELDAGTAIGQDAAVGTPAPYRATEAQMDMSRAEAEQYFAIQGFDPLGVAEVRVAWGECDMFQ